MQVLVVGAGPAGATLARLLARSGVAVTLVERERDFERVFRGEGLMPGGLDALREMALLPLLGRIPSREIESWDLFVEGRPIFSVPEPRAELGELALRVVPQPRLLEAVVADAARHPGFRFEPGTTARDLLHDDGRVVGVRVKTTDGPDTRRADLVIGCDGRASLVRKRAGLALDLLPERYDVLWFKLPAPERLRGRCAMLLMASRRGVALAYVSWDGRLQVALMVGKGAIRDLRGTDWAEEIAGPAPDWLADHVRAVRDRIEGPGVLDVIVGRCPRWSAPGVLLLGDAAHPMSPVRAQGINVALRDAVVAANQLVPVLRAGASPEAIDAAARAVQAEREPEIVRAQTLQRRDTRGIGTPLAPAMMAVARGVGPLLGRFEWAKRAWLDQQHDLRFGTTEVRLRV